MIIKGYDYKFLYSIGAYLAITSAKFPEKPVNTTDYIRTIFGMAVIMSKEYEDAKKLDNPDYETHYLTVETVKALPMHQFNQLAEEVNQAVLDGQKREVEAEPIKKKGEKVKK